MGLKLFDHQKKGIDLLSDHDCFGLFWDMGSGKTLTMLLHLSNLMLADEVKKALWLAPKSALGAVERDLEIMRKTGLGYRADIVEERLTCLNYEKLSRKDSKWRKEVDSTEWDALVLDEAHCVCHPTSNRTKYIIGTKRSKGLAGRIKYKYAMTGTPVTNSRYEDFWSFLKLVDFNYMSYSEFEDKYLRVRYIPGTHIKLTNGYQHTEELLDEVAAVSQSITKKECLDLPEVMPDNVLHVPMSNQMKRAYDTALLEDIIELNDYEVLENGLVRTLRLRQIATGHVSAQDGFVDLKSSKVSYVMELIENNPHKTVIFYEFRASFELLTKALESAKIPFMFLNGQQSNKMIWRDFQNASEDECRVFLVQYRSGNAGIDLFTSSDTIFFEPCLSSTVLNQARSRTHRNGVSRACTFTFLLTEDTIEDDIYARLQGHEDFNEKMWIELKRKEYRERNGYGDQNDSETN